MTRPVAIRAVVRQTTGSEPARSDQDLVAVEAPLTLRVQGPDGAVHSMGLLMRTPGHDEDLAVGALFSEGVITRAGEVRRVRLSDEEAVVEVTGGADLTAIAGRGSAATSACGLCGRLEVLQVDQAPGLTLAAERPMVSARDLAAMPAALRTAQAAFAETGGLHAAGVFTPAGALHVVREDVGRHNAVDKVAGALLREGRMPASEFVLVVSGRVAYEIVQKAARCGIPVILAVGAPTDLAVDAARSAGITLAGFARADRFNVYTWPDRVRSA